MSLTQVLRQLDKFRSEFMITICSIWASAFMFWYPTDFDNFPMAGLAYNLMQYLVADERWWGSFLLLSAITKAIRFLLLIDNRCWGISIILSKIGLTMSFIWWTILGISAMAGGFFILGFLPVVIGFTSAWLVLDETALPE